MKKIAEFGTKLLRYTEKYIKTDMVYLAKGTFWLNLNFFSSSLLGFILSIFFARLLSPNTYGTYQYILSISAILGVLTLTGFNPAITRAVAQGFEGTFKKSLPIQLKWGLLSTFVSFFISGYYIFQGATIIGASILIMGILLPISNAFNTHYAYLTGKKDFRGIFIYNTILTVVYFASMLTTLFLGGGVFYLILAYFLSQTVANIIIYFYITKTQVINEQVDDTTFAYGKHLSIMNILSTLASKLDNIIIFQFIGAPELAIYSFARIFPEKISGLWKSISTVALPKLSEKTTEEVRESILGKTIKFIIITIISAGVYVLIAPFAFSIFFPQYTASIAYSQVLSLSIVMGAAGLPVNALISQKAKKELYIFTTTIPFLQNILLLFMIIFYGLWGAVISKIIGNALYIASALFLLTKPKKV